MPSLKTLSAADIIKFLNKEAFVVHRQKGSHIVCIRQLTGFRQILTVPNHKTIKTGTQKDLFNQFRRFIPEETLRDFFYNE